MFGSETRNLVRLLATCRRRYALGALLLAFADGGQLAVAWLVGASIDALGDPTVDSLAPYAGGIAAAALITASARYGWRQMIFGSSRIIERRIRQRLYDHLQTLPARFHIRRKIGELMAHATNDVPAIQLAGAGGMMAGLDAGIQFTGAAAMMVLTVDARLAILALAPLLLLTPATYVVGRQLHARYGEVQSAFGDLSDRVQEAVSGVRVVKGFARETAQIERFGTANREYRDRYARMLRWDVAFDPMIALLAGLAFAVGLGYGGTLVLRGDITLGRYVAFNTYLGMLVWPMLALGWVMNLFQRATASLARLQALFDEEPDVRDDPDAVPLPAPRGHIVASGLTFRYAPDLPVALEDVAFDLKPGHTLGVLGRTGSGKSTLASLLLRVFEPPPDSIFLDGHDIRRIRLSDLRDAIAYVPQEGFLFSRSIAENIDFADEPHSRTDIERAARLADVHDDIVGFPQGYDTQLGERGITLSGGQRQRVCLARALLREVPILLLDDCLSAVDTQTEHRILAGLRPFTAERTTIIIAHRISALRHADEIVVLDGGRIVERGDHDGLVAAGGEYALLWQRQQLVAAIEAGGDTESAGSLR